MKTKTIISVFFISMIVASACLMKNAQQSTGWMYVDQGASWTDSARDAFYREDQGSQIIPYAWIASLRDSDGMFLRDQLNRYGFLAMGNDSLPVGFTLAKDKQGLLQLGMTCAACHTKQIEVGDISYRIDGGPGMIDMESFSKDLDKLMHAAVSDPEKQKKLIADILSYNKKIGQPDFTANQVSEQLKLWDLRNHTIMSRALPDHSMWGMGRIDALGMIFNRVTGMDLGQAPDYLIAENIAPAGEPVRIPFLWNASKQDRTQWAGTSINGNRDWALMRNTGEVCGVWGVVHPKKDSTMKPGLDFLSDNSVNFEGLQRNEDLVIKIGAPKWPWSVNAKLAAEGQAIYKANCESCHGIKQGAPRPPVTDTWLTPVVNVGTDASYYNTLGRTAKTGVLEGVLPPTANALMVVGATTVSMLKQWQPGNNLVIPQDSVIIGRFESRVLQGIWAAAPYLHNGSVPTLSDLLKPAEKRPKSFELGAVYDTLTVGLSAKQKNGAVQQYTVGAPNSGNSNLGHEYGTSLSEKERAALLEYLKTL